MKQTGLARLGRSRDLLRFTIGLMALVLTHPAFSQTVRQITDFREDRLGEFAVDDSGGSVVVVTTADPFGANAAHEFQAVAWNGAQAGAALTAFGGLLNTVSVSDDGQWIAVVSIADPLGQNHDRGPELFLQSADGSVLRQLTGHPSRDSGRVSRAAISGSANRIAFVEDDDLWVVGAAGDGLTLVTAGAGKLDSLSMSDDGTVVVFSANGDPLGGNADGSLEVFRVAADGSDPKQLTSSTDDAEGAMISGDGTFVTYSSEQRVYVLPATGGTPFLVGFGTRPSITDDATWVYYSAMDEDNFEVYRYLLASGSPQRLTRTAPPLSNERPLVSGDGTHVAFRRCGTPDNPGDQCRAMAMSSDGSAVEQLGAAETRWRQWEPDITPDGKRIVFLAGPEGHYDVYRVEADGSDLAQITNGADARHPSVSEDGETIVFQSSLDLTGENPCGRGQIFTVHADGSGLSQLSPSGTCAAHEHPVISRDGSTVVYQEFGGVLYSIPAAGGAPSWIVYDGSDYPKMPRVSHDGAWVVYQSTSNIAGRNPSGAVEAFAARTDRTFLDQASSEPQLTLPRPDISADGSRVVFADRGSQPDYDYNDIWLYQPTTTTAEPLTQYAFASDTRISGNGQYVYFGDLERLRVATGEIERALGLVDPRVHPTTAVPDDNTDFAVDSVGRAVFAWPINATAENPDLGYELWLVDFDAAPRFDIDRSTPAQVRFSPDPRGLSYDVIRGDLADVAFGPDDTVQLGPVECLDDDTPISSATDPDGPRPNQVFFYLFRWTDDWGSSSSGAPRVVGSGDCSPG